ncbi:hypothetical protein [Paenibacillus ihuae]|uniref:hypothetical protein n=1 Tax=Paenibacillus ihuae TaxID=1232431 RepID=UPI000A6BF43C|nr:hypothetical protein [Paenibacillus ihuae]
MPRVNVDEVDEYIEKHKSSFYSKMLEDEKKELAKANAIRKGLEDAKNLNDKG